MKKIVFCLCCCLTISFSKSLEEIYLENGLEAVGKAIESKIQSKSYWENRLKDKDVEYGYYDYNTFIINVDKKGKKFYFDEYKDNKIIQKSTQDALTGLMGEKLKEGDLKTPIGVYQITKRFTPSDEYYGPVAFNLSYPNIYDKVRKRTGSGIWIHGFPLSGDIREDVYKTKGCVVLKNNLLLQFEKNIKDKGGFVLINEDGILKATDEQIADIFAELYRWKKAWTNSDIKDYLDFYDSNFTRFDGMKLDKFVSTKTRIFAKKENKFIKFSNFSITPYPTTEKGKFFRIAFYENYKTPTYNFDGKKTLYVKLVGDKMKILVEE